MLVAFYFLLPITVSAQQPKLVIGLVVDQMRWDYLYRYHSRYGNDGFRRLLNEGFNCQQVNLDYIPAFTACGHASIYTGSVPAINGITGNEWVENGISSYCTADTTVKTIGSFSGAGRMSPKNLLVTTIGDELKLATNFRSKVIGIAIKDRGAILPAGHTADAAYWFDESTGNWITSSYYRNELPEWVKEFNGRKLAEKYLKMGWDTFNPLNTYLQSTEDDSRYEGNFPNESKPIFPHQFDTKTSVPYTSLKTTPYANTFTFQMAELAIKKEKLGARQTTDLLTISLSGTDYIGHQFGPNAMETEDAYLRLDRDLGLFLNFLDKQFGVGNYTFFLTADHGAAHNPNYLLDRKIPAGYWDAKALQLQLNQYFKTKYQVDGLIKPFLNYQLYLDAVVIKNARLNVDVIKQEVISIIKQQPGIADAIDLNNVNASALTDDLRKKITNGYYRKRSGAMQIILEAGWFQLSNDQTGTIHGAWNAYDSHIPLIFMGRGINKGISYQKVSSCDIAPTLAALLKIQEPSGSIGKVISGVFKSSGFTRTKK